MTDARRCDECGKFSASLAGWVSIAQLDSFIRSGPRSLNGDYCAPACVAERAIAFTELIAAVH